MENSYAQALWRMIEAGTQPKKAVRALYDQLCARGRQTLMPKVARSFERLAARDRGRNGVVLSVAATKEARSALTQTKKLLRDLDVGAKAVTTHVDETLIGGWRLEGRERLVDASFKKYLLDMYNRTVTQ